MPQNRHPLSTHFFPASLAAMLFTCIASPLFAVDGVIEINQARALVGSVTAGDSAGFPVTISEPGSYRLTGNLTTPDYFHSAIHVASDDVTLDLNGFTISGPVTCSGSGSSLVCSPSGSWHGIDANGRSRIVVRNGTVRGFTSIGVFVGSHGRLETLVITSNGGSGIEAGVHSTINAVTSTLNGGSGGIYLGNLTKVTYSTVTQNRSFGLLCGDGCMIRDNVSKLNGASGINVGSYGTVSNNIAESNEGDGISAGSSVVVSFNSSNLNGASGGAQIRASSGCLVTSNTVRNAATSGYGLSLHASAGFSNNVISASGTGAVLSGVNLGQNLCTGSLCP